MCEGHSSEEQTNDLENSTEEKPACNGVLDFIRRKALFIIALLSIIFLLSFKYDLVSSNGKAYRINRITGNVQEISGSRFVQIDKISVTDKYGLSKLRELNQLTVKNSIKCDLSILWRNNKLYYKFKVSPYNGEVKKIRENSGFAGIGKGFTIQFYDANDFLLAEIPVKIHDMTAIVGDNNKTEYLIQDGKIEMSYDDAKNIYGWSAGWNF